MKRNALARLGLLIVTLLAGAGQWAHAVPGLDHQFGTPHYTDQSLNMVVLDLEVKALGSTPVRIERSWVNGQWVWNEQWGDLGIIGGTETPPGETPSTGVGTLSRPYAVMHAGKSYVRAGGSGGGSSGAVAEDPDADVVLSNLPFRTLTALKRGKSGYRWQDIYGNRNDYDPKGRLTQYVFYNGIQVRMLRDAQQRLLAVKDHLGTNLVTFTYTDDDLTQVADYSGRTVTYEYTDHQLMAVVDVLGQRWEYHYSGKVLAGYTDPLKQRTTLSMGGDSLQELRRPDGRWTRYSRGYDTKTEQYSLRQEDQSGLVTERWHDRLGHVVRKQINGELQFTREYTLSDKTHDVGKVAEGYRISGRSTGSVGGAAVRSDTSPPIPTYVVKRVETDAEDRQTITEYNRYNQITRIQYPDDSVVTRSYDGKTRRLTEKVDERGIKTQYRYDGAGNRSQVIEAAGTPEQRTTTYRYDPLGRLAEELRPGGGETPDARWQYHYDDKGNRTVVVDPLNHETTYTHDVMGNVLTLTNALNKTWASTYDAVGNLTSLADPLEQKVIYHYDKLGQGIKVIAPNEAEFSIEFSAAGLPTSIVDAANAKTLFEYDSSQRLIALIDPLGNRNERKYDNRGRLLDQTDAANNRTHYQYDKSRLSGIDYPTYNERYQYDSRDQVKSETREFAQSEETKNQIDQYTYLADGLLEQWQDAANNPAGNGYDALGHIISSSDAEGGTTHFAHDKRGNLSQVTDPLGRITQFKYDIRDSLISEIKPGDATAIRTERRYSYDAVGNLKQTVTPDGRVSQYRYDDANRLIQTRHFANITLVDNNQAERTTDYSYTALNHLKSYEDEESKAVYVHDALGRVSETTITYKTASPNFSKSYAYSYDANGRKATYTNPEEQTYAYLYTSHGQLAGVSIPGEGSISFKDFRWLQPQSVIYPGGGSLSVIYDGLLRYTSRHLKDPAGNPIQTQDYSYDAVNNITAIDSQDGRIEYGYDKLHRLTATRYPQGDARTNEAYVYDGVGNRLDEASKPEELDIGQWQYNAHNQLVQRDGIGYRYNADGHLIEKGALLGDFSLIQSGGIDHWHYQYDSRERLVEVRKNGELLVRYAYNPLGQRISKNLAQSNQVIYYLYSEEGLVAEYDQQGNLKQEYAYDPTKPWMSQPLFTRAKRSDTVKWAVSYFGTSHLGAPDVAFEKSGEVTWRAKTQVFGNAVLSSGVIDNELRFPGQYFDEETGLHYNFLRDYDAVLGRYIQADPIGMNGGVNQYNYGNSNSLRYTDPHGTFAFLIPLAWEGATLAYTSYRAYRLYRAISLANQGYSAISGGLEWDDSEEADNHDLENEVLEERIGMGDKYCVENISKISILKKALTRQLLNLQKGRERYGVGNQEQERLHKPRIEKIRKKLKQLEEATANCPGEEDRCEP
ncbi:MAG: RHS repeat-associated core domain-containing protein [Pseudomonas sp.]|uniref:RHS repeat-associated core domain-containing protein n=1 Tax=Pseudomonas sp. TaxID=306 RepID=UPI0033914DED